MFYVKQTMTKKFTFNLADREKYMESFKAYLGKTNEPDETPALETQGAGSTERK